MNILQVIADNLTSTTKDADLYIHKNGKKYRFKEPADIRYQGELAYFEDVETGKVKLLHTIDLKSLAHKEKIS